MAFGGIGGIVGSMGLKLLTDATSSQTREAGSGFLQDADKFANANMFNAAGFKGAAVNKTYMQKYNNFGPSAEGRLAYNNQNMIAQNVMGAAQGNMDSAARTAERSTNTQTSAMLDELKKQGASPAVMMAVANKMGALNSSNIGQQAVQQNAFAGQAAGQAAGIMSQAEQGRNQDLATQYNLFVKPFEAQSSGLGNAMVNSIPGTMVAGSQGKSATNPLAGFAAGLGYEGRQMQASPWNNQAFGQAQGLMNQQFDIAKMLYGTRKEG